jgi:hypothetical protein
MIVNTKTGEIYDRPPKLPRRRMKRVGRYSRTDSIVNNSAWFIAAAATLGMFSVITGH